MPRRSRLTRRVLVLPIVLALVALAGVTASAAKTPPKVNAYTAKQWAQLIAKAKQEGSVAIYSSQSPTSLADFAAKFKDKYGITVSVNRNIDTVTAAQITAEEGTGRAAADMWVAAGKPLVLGAVKNNWLVDARGPDLFKKGYDRAKYAKPGKAFLVGTAIASFGWNTQRWPSGLKDFPDLLNPDLGNGKIGVVAPSVPGHVDFWRDYLVKKYGRSFVTRLAALKPRLYVSSFPLQNALAAGEVAAAVFVTPQTLDLKAQGAPVDFKLTPGGSWNSPWWGMILKQAPHPAAAQLLADYMVTPEGQASINKGFGAVLKGVPGTYSVALRSIKLADFTPQKIATYIQEWKSLFG
jgi:iron(III) transport system substrate-binding protein